MKKLVLLSAVLLACGMSAPASALPMAPVAGFSDTSNIEQIRARGPRPAPRRVYGRRGGHGGAGAAAAIGVLGVLGAIAATNAYREPTVVYQDDGSVEYCMRRFRSYDPASGTYVGLDGRRRYCP